MPYERGDSIEMAKITINDIAQMVGVSTATISNYLNGNFSRMSEKTRGRIAQIIQNTNYRPSNAAHQLATNQARTIGVSVVDITNPFTATVLSGIYQACGLAGYSVIFTNAANDKKVEIDNINKLRQQDTAGLIIDPIDPESPIFKIVSNENVVLLDRQAEHTRIDTVVTDNFSSVKSFIEDMKQNGYDEIYFVSWPIDTISTRFLRYKGFKEAMHYTDDQHLLIVHEKEFSDLKEKLSLIMEQRKEKRIGFFSMNAKVFIHLITVLQRLGFNYPEDFGIGTYEDLEWMEIFRPGISCISQNSFVLGERSVEILLSKLKQQSEGMAVPVPRIIEVPTTFVKRKSY